MMRSTLEVPLSVPTRTTAVDLLAMPDAERYELADGVLLERKMGTLASWVAGEVFAQLRDYGRATGVGWAFPADAGYQCFADDGDRVRRPDASFVCRGRFPDERFPQGHTRLVPDLAVEVVSPNDDYSEVRAKTDEYLAAGVRCVWVLDPRTRTVEVRRPGGSAVLMAADELTGEDVLPGFHCPVANLFPPG